MTAAVSESSEAPEGFEAIQHPLQDALRFLDRPDAMSRHPKEPFRPAAARRRRLTGARLDEALRLKAAERCVDGANRHIAAGPRLDLLADCDAIGAIAEPEDG